MLCIGTNTRENQENIEIYVLCMYKIDRVPYNAMICFDVKALTYCGWCGFNIISWSVLRSDTTNNTCLLILIVYLLFSVIYWNCSAFHS